MLVPTCPILPRTESSNLPSFPTQHIATDQLIFLQVRPLRLLLTYLLESRHTTHSPPQTTASPRCRPRPSAPRAAARGGGSRRPACHCCGSKGPRVEQQARGDHHRALDGELDVGGQAEAGVQGKWHDEAEEEAKAYETGAVAEKGKGEVEGGRGWAGW